MLLNGNNPPDQIRRIFCFGKTKEEKPAGMRPAGFFIIMPGAQQAGWRTSGDQSDQVEDPDLMKVILAFQTLQPNGSHITVQ